ncbi:hypothetical protein [uncultured Aquimarina sp.]|uniref:hypothetical protein n=1 Tax=uncultured Aquimarina sp. TaxID=575652 RepID=UPI00261D4A51|nr:hypothetical protein [uncultured Aquimarina sp.]
MTAQISDHIIYQGEIYDLTGYTEEIPFFVESFGLNPVGKTTACWRGFQRTFIIDKDQLLIQGVDINLKKENSKKSPLPSINGVTPNTKVRRPKSFFFNTEYEGLNYLIEYSGSLLIGKDFIRNLYVHMGFHPAWKYEKVLEFEFNHGVLVKIEDLSKKMKGIRAELQENENSMKDINTHDWIESTFNQKYKK